MDPIVTEPWAARVPIVASIPHGGHVVPEEIARALWLDLDRIYLDWYATDLYSFLPELGIPSVAARMHRLVADVNRQPVEPLVGAYLKRVVASTYGDERLYAAAPSASEAAARVALAHAPYHRALDALIQTSLSRFGSIVLLDLHSFGMPLGVDVVICDGRGTTAARAVVDTIEACFRDGGFSVRRNDPWTSGWIIKRFADEPSVDALLIEVNQRVYLDETEIDLLDASRPTFDPMRIQQAAGRLRAVLDRFVDAMSLKALSDPAPKEA